MKKKKTEENSNYNVELDYIDGKTVVEQMDSDGLDKWLPQVAEELIRNTLDPSSPLPPLSMVVQFLPRKFTKPWAIFYDTVAEVKFDFNGSMYIWNRLDPDKTGWYINNVHICQ